MYLSELGQEVKCAKWPSGSHRDFYLSEKRSTVQPPLPLGLCYSAVFQYWLKPVHYDKATIVLHLNGIEHERIVSPTSNQQTCFSERQS